MDSDTLTLLEDRIVRAVETVNRLKREKEAALASVADSSALEARVAELTVQLKNVQAERDSLKADKEAVRQRIEKLLLTIDSLASS